MEGERYKKSPELLLQAVNHMPKMEAPCQFITWKRWDKLEEYDAPEVVVFFATPDILSGLFTLANFEEAEPNGVLARFLQGAAPSSPTLIWKKISTVHTLSWACSMSQLALLSRKPCSLLLCP